MAPMIMNPFRFGSASGVGGWVELGRHTLGSDGSTMEVTGLEDKRYLMFLSDRQASGSMEVKNQFNSDTGTNYSSRFALDGSESTGTNKTLMSNVIGWNTTEFNVSYVANLAGKEKLLYGNTVADRSGVNRVECAGKWDNTSNAISAINQNTSSGNLASGAELVVLGWDPTDTHTTNFWEELASVDLSGGAATSLDSGTITAKKYLWVQLMMEQTADSNYPLRFNSDSSSIYEYRYRTDGGTEFNHSSQSGFNLRSTTANLPVFVNMFITNSDSNNKMIIEHDVKGFTAGAGNAPLRTEQVGTWANTSSQITSIQLHTGSGSLATNTHMRVWGSD